MAILDTLFGGSSQAELLGGLLGEDKLNQLRSQATQTGLINAAIGYLAQPKNQRFGSALPYLARAFTAGQQGAQGVYDDALRSWQMQQKIDEANREKAAREARQRVLPELLGMPSAYRGTTTQTVQGAEYATPTGDVSSPFTAQFQTQRMLDTQVQTPTFNEAEYIKDLAMSGYGDKMLEATLAREKKSPFGPIDISKYTPSSVAKFNRSGNWEDLDLIDKPNKPTAFIQNYEYAKSKGYKGTPEDWQKLNIITQQQFLEPYRDIETQLKQEEAEYRYGTPQAPMPKSVTMQDVADTAKASGKTTQQVINDLKARGITVRSK